MAEQLVTVKQVAQILAVKETKVRGLCLRGIHYDGLDAIKIDTQWRISVSELDRFIEARKGRS
jgi:excisionase family DNA binding protein